MSNNRLIIAAAGSGKTSYLIDQALKIKNANVLITTYTEANEQEIKNKIIEKNKYIPMNCTIQTWFSFLLQHGVRPYQNYLSDTEIRGLNLIPGQSTKFIRETDTERYYLDTNNKIYSDKLSKFVLKCNTEGNGKIINRLSLIYPNIFIDEVQDLSGYDLEFLKLLFNSNIETLLVGDPRQGTYSTNNAAKNKQYSKSKIVNFFEDNSINIDKDDSLLTVNYRSISEICGLSNKLYPDFKSTTSGNENRTGHDGLFLIRSDEVEHYLSLFRPMQLRYNRTTKVNDNYPVMNFGESKGLSFDRVLIYPTEPVRKWLKNYSAALAPESKAKLYVAITRARNSVAFVFDYKNCESISGMQKFSPISKPPH